MTTKLVIKNAKLDDQRNQTQDASIINKSIRNQFFLCKLPIMANGSRGVFRTESNIYEGPFIQKIAVNYFYTKSS